MRADDPALKLSALRGLGAGVVSHRLGDTKKEGCGLGELQVGARVGRRSGLTLPHHWAESQGRAGWEMPLQMLPPHLIAHQILQSAHKSQPAKLIGV